MQKKIYMTGAVGSAVVLIMAIIMVIMPFETAYAATLENIPSTDLRVSSSNMLTMNKSNFSEEWTGVNGKTVTNDSGYKLLCVPIKTKKASFTYKDFLDITFSNIGTIDGRQMDAKVHFNSMTVSERKGSATGERSDNYMAAAILTGASLSISTSTEDGGGYKAAKEIDVTVTVYWHDTGETVDLPFFQCVKDVDAGDGYYREGWESVSGYSGVYYKYDTCYLKFEGNKISAPDDDSDVSGDDSLLKAGIYAPTTGGVFRSEFYAGNCATGLRLYSSYAILDEPVKESDGKERNLEGDTVNYTVSQKTGTFYVDTMTQYTSFVMSDTLPEGVTYKSAKVYDGIGKEITGKGTVEYDMATRTVTFTMGSEWLADMNNYTGQSLKLKIATSVDEPEAAKQTITNKAQTIFEKNVALTSNEVQDDIYKPYKVIYKYVSGTEGKRLPEEISTTSGSYKISDPAIYYIGDTVNRKSEPSDGTTCKVHDAKGEYKGSWVLTWDESEKTVKDSDIIFTGTWRYIAAPRISIIKKLPYDSNQFTAAHGEPSFIFRITGKDSGKSWYKSVTFSKRAVEAVKNSGTYTSGDNTKYMIKDGYIYAAAADMYLPEDDYTVEEMDAMRFSEINCKAQYHNDGGTKVIGTSKSSIQIPLKLSSYKKTDAGYDADYASVCFENSKTRWDRLSHTDMIVNRLEAE